jgi:hypothetical protein
MWGGNKGDYTKSAYKADGGKGVTVLTKRDFTDSTKKVATKLMKEGGLTKTDSIKAARDACKAFKKEECGREYRQGCEWKGGINGRCQQASRRATKGAVIHQMLSKVPRMNFPRGKRSYGRRRSSRR